MNKTVTYPYVFFDAPTIRKAITTLRSAVEHEYGHDVTLERMGDLTVSRGNESWGLDNFDEFLAELGRGARYAYFTFEAFKESEYSVDRRVTFTQHETRSEIRVTFPTRDVIERVQQVFADAAPGLHRPPPKAAPAAKPLPRVFIGHGGKSSAWRDLKDHLSDKHKYEVIAYESGARAGHTIRDILEEMLGDANFAILVMTAEDEQADGTIRARQNVIHEAGLFQGKLGFPRAIVVLQNGVENFSNIDGVQYLPFTHTINETFGEILATIKREFAD